MKNIDLQFKAPIQLQERTALKFATSFVPPRRHSEFTPLLFGDNRYMALADNSLLEGPVKKFLGKDSKSSLDFYV